LSENAIKYPPHYVHFPKRYHQVSSLFQITLSL
jgi:hypothetical protein